MVADRRDLRRVLLGARRRTARALARRYSPFQDQGDVYDTSFWPWLEPYPESQARAFAESIPPARGLPWDLEFPSRERIREESDACRRLTGVWPISFSHPGDVVHVDQPKSAYISRIVPGQPYSFGVEADYEREYSQVHFALTHRKAGWDCFRHVEILACGTVPLMLDADQIPDFSMVHYPKSAMAAAVEHVHESGDPPDPETVEAFGQHFAEHLTTEAMTRYVLWAAGGASAERVLFVDERLPVHADYQSALALVGLKQVFKARCEVMFPVDYLYSDTPIDVSALYGRGFGYTRRLRPEWRAPTEERRRARSPLRAALRRGEFDFVVVGSVARNGPLAHALLEDCRPEQTIWIHGEDQPPSPREMHFMKEAGVNAFVRSVPQYD